MAKAICERCRENQATSVLYDPADFAIHGVDPPDEVLHPVCEDCYHLFAHPGQKAAPEARKLTQKSRSLA